MAAEFNLADEPTGRRESSALRQNGDEDADAVH
jgi:hypothetical protein